MTDSLQAPLRAKILSSEPVAPQEVRNILVECLTQNPPAEATARALLSRLEGGLRRSLEQNAPKPAVEKNKKRTVEQVVDVEAGDEEQSKKKRKKEKKDKKKHREHKSNDS